MNFNVYLEDALAKKLATIAKRTGARRNTLIREAVARFVAQSAVAWPESVLGWAGDPTLTPFEVFRDELLTPPDDPLTFHAPARRRRKA